MDTTLSLNCSYTEWERNIPAPESHTGLDRTFASEGTPAAETLHNQNEPVGTPTGVTHTAETHMQCVGACTFPQCINVCAYSVGDDHAYHRSLTHRYCLSLTTKPYTHDVLATTHFIEHTGQAASGLICPTVAYLHHLVKAVPYAFYALHLTNTKQTVVTQHIEQYWSPEHVY